MWQENCQWRVTRELVSGKKWWNFRSKKWNSERERGRERGRERKPAVRRHKVSSKEFSQDFPKSRKILHNQLFSPLPPSIVIIVVINRISNSVACLISLLIFPIWLLSKKFSSRLTPTNYLLLITINKQINGSWKRKSRTQRT